MAEFTEIAQIKKRMCKTHSQMCITKYCPLSSKCNGKDTGCEDLYEEYPEEYERICLEWAKENPEITNRNKLYQIVKEAFGEDMANSFNTVKGCAFMACKGNCMDCQNINFWDNPYIELKEKQNG